MDGSAQSDGQNCRHDGAITRDLRCPGCRYCLLGLPIEGRCPECGFAYVAQHPNAAKTVDWFSRQIPAVWRCGISPRLAVRHPVVPFVTVLLTACVSSALVVAGFCLATKFGFMFATPEYPPRENVLASFGIYGVRGGLLRWKLYGIRHYATLWFFGQTLVGMGVWCLYAIGSRSVGKNGRILRRLGLLAACSSTPVLLLPGLIVSLWQIPSVIAPKAWSTNIDLPLVYRMRFQLALDFVQATGTVLLMLTSVWITTRIMRRHSAFARRLRQSLANVRAADGPGDSAT